jgi:hypothetical protein
MNKVAIEENRFQLKKGNFELEGKSLLYFFTLQFIQFVEGIYIFYFVFAFFLLAAKSAITKAKVHLHLIIFVVEQDTKKSYQNVKVYF